MLSNARLSDLRVARALLVGPWRVEPWARYRRTLAPAEVDDVRRQWRACVAEAVAMRRDAAARRRFRELGEHFGYPRCCVDDFCQRVECLQRARRETLEWSRHKLLGRATPSAMQRAASCGTGFVPCHEHALALMDVPRGRERLAALSALIVGRAHPRPFPVALPGRVRE